MDRFLEGVRKFREEVFPSQRELFEALGAGQKPRALLVTCSDSRIDPSLVMQTQPGELFVLRNAGNLVPPAEAGAGAEAATIEYAVRVLGVRHLIVCGHSHCGAMAALSKPEAAEGLPAVAAWLEHAKPVLERARHLPGVEDDALRVVAANVLVQLDHVRTHPAVAEAEARGELDLHGWVYRFESGEVAGVDAEAGLRPLTA